MQSAVILVLGALLLAVILDAVPGASGSADATAAPMSVTSPKLAETYGQRPLAFVPNVGQISEDVFYSAHSDGASFYFTPKEAVFALTKGEQGVALRLGFVGANPATRIDGLRPGRGKINYLLGTDRATWRTGVPTFGEVVYRDLWPGIDMVFRGAARRLKYEFVVRPGANARDIRLAYRGADGLAVSPAGELLIRTPVGTLRDERPRSWQVIGGRRVPVESRFALDRRNGTYGFGVAAHDARHALVIDPGLLYSTYLGGSGDEWGNDVAVDAEGSVYVTGFTQSTAFPTTSGAFDTTLGAAFSTTDAYVTKLDPSGSSLVYSTYLGGESGEDGLGVAVDGDGDAYVAGRTNSADFPTTPEAFQSTLGTSGISDAFVAKLNSDGSALLYSTYLGGDSSDGVNGIAVDPAGSAFLVGDTVSTNFPTTPGAFAESTGGSGDVFVAKLGASGSALLYSTYLGGGSSESGIAIAIDGAGNAFVTGETLSTTFPTTPGAFDRSPGSEPGFDAYVTKLNASGTALGYSTFLGGAGSGSEHGHGIAVDGDGNAHVVGSTLSTDFPTTPGAFDESANGTYDAFVTKLNPSGAAAIYSTYLGASGGELAVGLAVDGAGDAFVTGVTFSTDFPTTLGAYDDSYNGGDDVFLARLNSSGSALVYSTYFGGTEHEWPLFGLAVDATGHAFFGGYTTSTDLPTTTGAFDTSANGGYDAYVVKLDTVVASPASVTLTPSTGTNPVGTPHTITAAVDDAAAQPVENTIVRFAVTGSVAISGECTTGSDGECTFTYQGPPLPGADSIAAYVDSDGDMTQDAGEPTASASKTWVLPPSGPPCNVKIADGSRITAANGDRATLGGTAKVTDAGDLDGQLTYRDNGPAQRITVKSTNVLAVVCSADRKRADVYGKASTDGTGSFDFWIQVEDNGHPGKGLDKYGILLSSGYDSGLQILEGGNVVVR